MNYYLFQATISFIYSKMIENNFRCDFLLTKTKKANSILSKCMF